MTRSGTDRKAGSILGIVFAPFIVGNVAERLQRIVVPRSITAVDEPLGDNRRFPGAQVGSLQDGAQHAFGRDRTPLYELPVARQHAAEIFRPRAVNRAVDDHVPDMAGTQILRHGRKAKAGVDFALRKQRGRLRGVTVIQWMSFAGSRPM
jgi:hypothetical protein